MFIRAQHFELPAWEGAEAEWEDGCAYSEGNMRFAIADGAGAQFESRRWAETLVTAYITAPPSCGADGAELASWFTRAGEAFHASFDAVPSEDRWKYADFLRHGSAATFAAIQFRRRSDEVLDWEGIAVGDCCGFHLHAGRLTHFPPLRPEEFGDEPHAVWSKMPDPAAFAERIVVRHGAAEVDDRFILASDAASRWLLETTARRPEFWTTLDEMYTEDFRAIVADGRSSGAMKRDDVVLVRIRVHGPGNPGDSDLSAQA
jgi:hypothetical protein